MGQQQLLFGGNVAETDPYFNNVSLLLTADGTDGTTTGPTVQDAISPNWITVGQSYSSSGAMIVSDNPFFSAYPYSKADNNASISGYYNDGYSVGNIGRAFISRDYNAGYIVGDTWCFEFWYKRNSNFTTFEGNQASRVIYLSDQGSPGSSTRQIYVDMSSVSASIYVRATNTAVFSFTPTINNDWCHVAVCGTATYSRCYVNGVLVQSGGSVGSFPASSLKYATIFGYNSSPGVFIYSPDLLISNFRVVSGNAVYTAAFTPPTSPLSAITGTTSLINATGTNTAIFNRAPTIASVTCFNGGSNTGVCTISSTQPKFGSTSLSLSNTVNSRPAFSVKNVTFPQDKYYGNSINYTFEFWYNRLSGVSGNNAVYVLRLRGKQTYIQFANAGNVLQVVWASYGGAQNISGSVPDLNTWYHIALVRNSGVVTFYINGVSQGTFVETGFYDPSFFLDNGLSSGTTPYGYLLDQIRFTPGIARYTSNFTPPSSPFPTSPPTTNVYGQSEYCFYNNTNPQTINSSFIVPAGVTSISAVCVGPGGWWCGGGGGLAYGTISVTPGERLNVQVGANPLNWNAGTNTIISRSNGTALLTAVAGGNGPSATYSTAGGVGGGYSNGGTGNGVTVAGGGTGGNGGLSEPLLSPYNYKYYPTMGAGGGAAGYTGNGGNGGNFDYPLSLSTSGTQGNGGGGGGGGAGIYWQTDTGDPCYVSYDFFIHGGQGGGVGLAGQAENGSGGLRSYPNNVAGGDGGAGSMTIPSFGLSNYTMPGGGCRGATKYMYVDDPNTCEPLDYFYVDGPKLYGGVRIIWGPGRSYPSTNTKDYVY